MISLLRFETKNNIIPSDYRSTIMSFFKKSLNSIADGEFKQKYYDNPERRNFTFAVKFPNAKFEKDKIFLDKNQFIVSFSTGNNTLGYIFMAAFIAQKGKEFNAAYDNIYILKSVQKIDGKMATSDSVMVRMLSPLCLREHSKEKNHDTYYSVKSDKFQSKAKELISNQLVDAGFSKNLAENIQIIPADAKKTVVRYYNTFIECSIGNFFIKADKAVINYFLKYGIGSRKSAGFGFAELKADGGLEV